MIYLLLVVAKIAERVVLIKLAAQVELGETQYGSRRRRGVHDAVATIFEFIKHHEGWATAMVSTDIEGGFDNIDTDLLIQFLQAWGASVDMCRWIHRWTRCRTIRFKFNGRLSKEYYSTAGIPQGFPLSPYLFGVYVADVFVPRMRYTPTVRQVVFSYVDDGVILVTTPDKQHTTRVMQDVFEDCDHVGKARNMGFSSLKTKWIGFGSDNWDGMYLNGVKREPEGVLRVLGFFFNKFCNFLSHVRYWLERGMVVRRRIGSLGRKFGDEGGIDAHGTIRLVQAAYLPTVYYGLEWITDYRSYVKSIQIHVHDCL